jgi:hypothetical protein
MIDRVREHAARSKATIINAMRNDPMDVSEESLDPRSHSWQNAINRYQMALQNLEPESMGHRGAMEMLILIENLQASSLVAGLHAHTSHERLVLKRPDQLVGTHLPGIGIDGCGNRTFRCTLWIPASETSPRAQTVALATSVEHAVEIIETFTRALWTANGPFLRVF